MRSVEIMRAALALSAFSLLPTVTLGFCPSGCSCTKETKPVVDCSGVGMASIPILLNPRTRSLTLRNNQISTVTLDELSIYTELEYLDLSYNRISSLEKGAFFRLSKLKSLRLNGNQLRSLVIETFRGLGNLKVLDMSENSILRLPTSVFADLRSLEVLNLTSNAIKDMSPGSLAGLTSLKDFYLTENQLTTIPQVALRATKALKLLDLGYNQISTLDNESFALLSNLEILTLVQNSLEFVDTMAFVGLLSLKQLDLRSNRLFRVPTLSFRVLTELDTLQIGNNLFDELPTSGFEGLYRLRQLIIDFCPHLKTVQLNAFSGLGSLHTLMLTGNSELASLHPRAFEHPNSLRQLYLTDNALSSLPSGLLHWKQLQVLDLRGNPWNCDCSSSWILEAPLEGNVKCASPPEKAGKYLKALRDDDIACSGSANRKLIFTIAGVVACLIFASVLVCLGCHFGRRLCSRFSENLNSDSRSSFYGRTDVLSYGYAPHCSKKSLLFGPHSPGSSASPECYYSSIDSQPRTVASTLSRKESFRVISNYPVPITEL